MSIASRLRFGLWSLGLVLVAVETQAQSASATLTARVQVQDTCTVQDVVLDFGQYLSGQSSAVVTQGYIELAQCGGGTVRIELDGGSAGNVARRKMNGPNNATLSYQLYRDTARRKLFGTGKQGVLAQLDADGDAQVLVVGAIPGGQRVPTGLYTDTVNITVVF